MPDGSYGLRVSEPGYDVLTDPVDNARLVFNSDWAATLPVHVSGQITLNAGTTITSYFTPLTYIPFGTFLWYNPGYPTFGQNAQPGWKPGHLNPSYKVSAGGYDTGTIAVRWGANFIWMRNNTNGTYFPRNTVIAYTIFRRQAL